MEKTMKRCDHCKQYKEETEFNWRFKSLGIRAKTCRECAHGFNKRYFEGAAKERHLEQVRERKQEARQVARDFVYDYLLTHPCSECGESDVRVLEFHHTSSSGKDMLWEQWYQVGSRLGVFSQRLINA